LIGDQLPEPRDPVGQALAHAFVDGARQGSRDVPGLVRLRARATAGALARLPIGQADQRNHAVGVVLGDRFPAVAAATASGQEKQRAGGERKRSPARPGGREGASRPHWPK
jgi:hypothetical protein